MNVNLTPNITGKNVNIIKGATQADLTNSVNNSKIYRDEAEAFSIVSEAKSVEASYSALNASISATTAIDKAIIATTKANEANNSAINASASEAVCIAKATITTDKANIATAQSVIATDKANEASVSANAATTQAGIATTKASEASTSASNALTSENNADTSEANALTYRNQAESFANSINPSDLVHISGTETITGNKTFSNGLIGNVTGNITGNADTATKLATARTINGVSFDGTANIVAPTNLTVGTRTTTAVPIESSSGTSASIPAASTTLAGVMTSADKVKLDGIASDANNYVLPARLSSTALIITDWNLAVENGWYMGGNTLNAPNAEWNLGIVETHNPIWVTQTVHSFTSDGSSNSAVWRRHKNGGTWVSWYRLQLNQEEQDARYVQGNDSRLITNGDQTWSGVKTFSSSPIVPTPTTGTQAVNKDYVDSSSDRIGLIDYGYIAKPYHIVAFGGEFNRANYPKLWAYLQENPSLVKTQAEWTTENTTNGMCGYFSSGNGTTTFRVPNLDKAFLRPDSRGVASYQGDAIRNITGTFRVKPAGGTATTGAFGTDSTGGGSNAADNIGPLDIRFNASNVVPTSTENRPKNIAVLPLIVAK